MKHSVKWTAEGASKHGFSVEYPATYRPTSQVGDMSVSRKRTALTVNQGGTADDSNIISSLTEAFILSGTFLFPRRKPTRKPETEKEL